MSHKMELIHKLILETEEVLGEGAMRGSKPTVKELNKIMGLIWRVKILSSEEK